MLTNAVGPVPARPRRAGGGAGAGRRGAGGDRAAPCATWTATRGRRDRGRARGRVARGPDGLQQRGGLPGGGRRAATPVVSAVGHERDVTLCDLVADLRVSTPTAAAEAVVPSLEALECGLDAAAARSAGAWSRAATAPTRPWPYARGRWGGRCGSRGERADAETSAPRREAGARGGPGGARAPRPTWTAPGPPSRRARARRAWARAGARVEGAAALLSLLSPGRTVARGYAIVRDAAGGRGDHRRPPPARPGQELEHRAARRPAPRPRPGADERRPAASGPTASPSRRPSPAPGRGGGASSRGARWASRRPWPCSSAGRATWPPAASAWPRRSGASRSSPPTEPPAGSRRPRPGAGALLSGLRPGLRRGQRGRPLAPGLPALEPLEVALDLAERAPGSRRLHTLA